MKIRMRQNSIRLRLTRSEVALFHQTGHLEEVIAFPSGTFRYTIQRMESSTLLTDSMRADFADGNLVVTVPAAQASRWATGGEVGMETHSGMLDILVEKDFQCAHGPVDEDAFPFGEAQIT